MSKNFQAIIIGSIIICIGIIIAGITIASHINFNFPTSMDVTTSEGSSTAIYASDTFLSESEAASLLKISISDFENLLNTGVLNDAFAEIPGSQGKNQVFSKNALLHYIGSNIGNSVPKK